MKKTKGKVLSLILASAMIVSSFSSMMSTSAATRTENGTVEGLTTKIYLASKGTDSAEIDIEQLIGSGEVKTYDKEDASGEEVVRISHVKGDKLLRFEGDGKVKVRKDASGVQTINVRYEADHERDDKEVTVRASKDITVYVDKENQLFLAKAGATDMAKRPGDLKSAAVNEEALNIGVYYATAGTNNVATYNNTFNASTLVGDDTKAKMKNDRVFNGITASGNVITLDTTYESASRLAKTGKAVLQIKLGKTNDLDSKFTDVNVEVAKKWNADSNADHTGNWEIGKRAGKTYLLPVDAIDWDDKDQWASYKDSAVAVGTYDEITTSRDIKVVGGSVNNLDAANVTVENGNVGDVKVTGTVTVDKGSVGTIKGDDVATVTITDGRVKAIDAENAAVIIDGGAIAGDIVADSVKIDAEDDDVNTVISGKVTADEVTVEASSDASVEVKGTIKVEGETLIEISGERVTLGTVDADYDSDVKFVDFSGTVKGLVNANQNIELENSKVVLSKIAADEIAVDEDSKLTVADARVSSIDGEGVFAFTAGKLFVEDGIGSDVILEIAEGLVVGETAFQSYDAVIDVEDLTTRGFTLETKSANKDTDKHIIKAVQFAGVKFDKTELTIAKGYSDTLTVASYPTGTALPAGATVEWNIDANDDYITMSVEGNVATIKAVDFSTDRSIENEATVTATVVDADGFVIEDLMEATVKVSAVAVPASEVTLDTNKPVALGTGAIYQYIANSSTKAVLSATSSDAQVATVALFNAADARGYKFQINALKEGTAVITTTDANGASKAINVTVTKVNGSLKADTTSYTFAPGAIYDVKFSVTGSTEVPVVTANGKVVSIAPRGNGVYRITAQNAGTAYVVAKAGNTHVSIKFDVVAGAAAKGVTGNNVSLFK